MLNPQRQINGLSWVGLISASTDLSYCDILSSYLHFVIVPTYKYMNTTNIALPSITQVSGTSLMNGRATTSNSMSIG